MIYQELIIDGVSVDLYEDTDITLEITSNLFNDITEITTNRSYTVSLPKTVRNLTLIGNCDKVGTNTDVPYTFHDCEYRRNGMPIIQHGRASVTECEDDISVSIYWGLFPFLEKLISEDKNLNELSNDVHILFEKTTTPYDELKETGYGYANYVPYQFDDDKYNEWSNIIVPETDVSDINYELTDGKRYTGEEVGGAASGSMVTDANYQSATLLFTASHTARINNVVGQGSYRGYAIIDDSGTVLQIADEPTTIAHTNGDINHNPIISREDNDCYFYEIEEEVTITKIDVLAHSNAQAGTLVYGLFDPKTKNLSEWGTCNVSVSNSEVITVEINQVKPAGKYFYFRQQGESNSYFLYYYLTENSGLKAFDDFLGTVRNRDSINICAVVYYDTGKIVPQSYVIQAPAMAAKLIVNNDKRYSTNASIVVTGPSEHNSPRSPQIEPPCLPSVTCQWVINHIENDYGLNIDMSAMADFMNSLVMPLVNKDSDEETIQGQLSCVINSRTESGDLSLTPTELPSSITLSEDNKTLEVNTACTLLFQIQGRVSFSLKDIEPSGKSTFETEDGNLVTNYIYDLPGNVIIMAVKHPNDDETDEYQAGSTDLRRIHSSSLNGYIYTEFLVGYGQLDLQEGDEISFYLQGLAKLSQFQFKDASLLATPQAGDNVPLGGLFPIVKNLPEISVTDYLKTLALLGGTFPLQRFTNNTVTFVTFNTIWNNKDKALDWSSKLIAAGTNNKPRQIEYSVDGYYQHNYYRWKEDDQTKGNYDADMEIKNETLEAENDAFELPFAASDGNRVPIYAPTEITEEENSWGGISGVTISNTYSACEPRLMNIIEDSEGNAALDFQINLPEIFMTKYANIIETITKAEIITEYVYLSDIEILNFDETVPVYLAQYGAYFAVLSIKVSSDGYSEVKMIKINL